MKSAVIFMSLLLLMTAPALAADYKNLNVEQFEKMRAEKTNIVLDVRTPKEYEAGHIPRAVLIDFNSPEFDKKIATLDKSKTYLVHCAAGGRSAKASAKMSALNFKSVYNLEGGYRAWEKAGNKGEK
ncbi:MAG TPA: rhodanese-like domain-containing protein [Verrucomicrobiae bacterium]|nr:rhodanese-like domain-containing protein [Verrucomicrobiae bacterium]